MTSSRNSLTIAVLCAAAALLLIAIYYSPIWWVSLKAPNYPPESFPDGVRIHFHVNGVFNGCSKRVSKEIKEEEALNCVHEMDTINHYVGMYPIAAGAPIERALSPFLFSLMGVMIVAFALPAGRLRLGLVAVAALAIGVWMYVIMYTKGGVLYQSEGYLQALQRTLDLDRADLADWSNFQAVVEIQRDTLGLYFRDLGEIGKRVAVLGKVLHFLIGLLFMALALLVVGTWRFPWFQWLLIGVPALLPLFFIIDYSGWLWWFGHNLNEMGAFTVKPFMPTVFGQGKVAQFSTYSYPYWGFGIMCVNSALLGVAALLRARQGQQAAAGA